MTKIFVLIGDPDDPALKACAQSLQTKCVMQTTEYLNCKIIVITPGKKILCDNCERENVQSLPKGRIMFALHYYEQYEKMYSSHNNYKDMFDWRLDPTKYQQKYEPIIDGNERVQSCRDRLNSARYDEILHAKDELHFFSDGDLITHVLVDGKTIQVDFVVQAKNHCAFSAEKLDSSLRITKLFKKKTEIPLDPTQAPTAALIVAKNVFVCGKAASFTTFDACAFSGIYVAEYIKTFLLGIMLNYFSVVTSNAEKIKEYESICGPVIAVEPPHDGFGVHVSPQAYKECDIKRTTLALAIIKYGTAKIFDENSHACFFDANALTVCSKDEILKTLKDIYAYEKKEEEQPWPGTGVDNWLQLLDRCPKLQDEQVGRNAFWRCSQVLLEKDKDEDNKKGQEISRYDGNMTNACCWGRIVLPRGENGFGFDSRFEPKTKDFTLVGKTFAEMDWKEKNKYSARASAILSNLYFFLFSKVRLQEETKKASEKTIEN